MDDAKVSVMQRLKAIREKMSAQAAEEAGLDPALYAAGSHAPVVSAGGGHAAAASTGPAAPASAVSMWDLAADPEDDDGFNLLADDEPAPSRKPPAPPLQLTNPTPTIDPVQTEPDPEPEQEVALMPARPAGRVKTRLMGFEHSNGSFVDVFEKSRKSASAHAVQFPVGWVVVVRGPGRGAAIALHAGVSQIGRDEDQAVQLDFGDTAISRKSHASIAFDDEENGFFVGHGGKPNLVRLNGKPLLSTEALRNGDEIRIGETTLRLVELCGEEFSWGQGSDGPVAASH